MPMLIYQRLLFLLVYILLKIAYLYAILSEGRGRVERHSTRATISRAAVYTTDPSPESMSRTYTAVKPLIYSQLPSPMSCLGIVLPV